MPLNIPPLKLLKRPWQSSPLSAHPPWELTGLSCIYMVHLLRHDDPSRYKPLDRFGGTDSSAIVHIGKTTDAAQRFTGFRSSVRGIKKHTAGQMLYYDWFFNKVLRDLYPTTQDLLDHLLFSWIPTPENKLDAQENAFLQDYVRTFWELPPLDSILSGSHGHKKKRPTYDPTPNPLRGVSCVYWAHLRDPRDPKRYLPINRLVGTDLEGILFIGQTGDMAEREANIMRTVRSYGTHTEANLLMAVRTLSPMFRKLVGSPSKLAGLLDITYSVVDPANRLSMECAAFDEYISRFAELPPFNSNVPGMGDLFKAPRR